MLQDHSDTHAKALQVNLDPAKYGTFAEIGAGQEVARWFFRVGGAAGTVAKAMSAYDMTFSDAIYGHSDRYVSRGRLQTMLDHEHELLLQRLNLERGDRTRFFVFADTVATRSYSRKEDGHGWLGIRFQVDPLGPASDITIHVRLTDGEAEKQQEALGIIGVNLVYGALFRHTDPAALIASLLDGVTATRGQVDMIEFTGPAFATVDNRLMSLELVRHGLTHAAMFDADGRVVQPSDALYKKCVLIERGSFRPATKVTTDMLRCALAQFVQEPGVKGEEPMVLFEMTLKNLREGANEINAQDFLDRADILATLGRTVLISNYGEYHRLAAYLFRQTKKPIGIVMGVPSLRDLFDESYYADLDGGILESFGRLFKNDLKVYAYPMLDPKTGALITAGNLRVAPHLRHLLDYLAENRLIESLRDFDERCLPIYSREVLARIRSGTPGWEEMTPPAVAELIKRRGLLGYPIASERTQAA
ncbi:MAG: TonB-dependent receptor [Vicinamibacterales bacterium]